MAETTYKDYIPANARVLVDYTQPPQDRVKFAYPENLTYEKAYKKFVLGTFKGMGTVRIVFGVLLGIALMVLISIPVYLPQAIISAKTAQTTAINPPPIAWQNLFTIHYEPPAIYNPLWFELAIAGVFLYYLFGTIIPYLEYFYYKRKPERLAEIIPRVNYLTSKIWRGLRYMKATPEDVKNGLFFLPIFHNVYLDYSGTGDMSDQLERIQVMEYDFNWQKIRRNGKLGPKKVNHYEWYTIFKFKNQPTDGELEIKYI